LGGHFQIILETNLIADVPAMQIEARLRIEMTVRLDDLRQPATGCGEFAAM